MFDWRVYLGTLALLVLAAFGGWLVSLWKRDVSIVDSLWGALFVLAAATYAWPLAELTTRGTIVLALVTVWALRLICYITWRNWGEGEDYRYRDIRRRNQPHFAFKSIYLVFALQAVFAWVISLPLLAVPYAPAPLGALDALAAGVTVFGLLFETVADWQLARFRSAAHNRGRVLDRGLWRYTRHPNYFGECCVWWGFACFGFAAGAPWSLVSPVLMTWLLLRISGVTLLEKSIGERRPGYAEYVRRTSVFVPLPPRKIAVNRAAVDL